MLRILLADDHELTRSGVRFLLEQHEDWIVCGEASNGRQAVAMAEELHPDFMVIDISMPDMNGLEATRQIMKSQPRTRVLVYTMHETEQIIFEALEAGARGLVLKSDAGENMVAAVESIANGKRFFTSSIVDTVVEAYLDNRDTKGDTSAAVWNVLTRREHEVVQLVAEGRSNKEIASTLFITDRTVEGHRREVMRKLKLESVADLVRYAVRNGIIQP
jgi:DNA-binding NarL/FixJ family response regulator